MVDDSAEVRRLTSNILKKTGVQLETAAGGQEALEKTRTSQYDLILMDIEMPRLNGIDTAVEIRRQGLKTPIIAYTGHQIDRVKKDAPPELFSDYLSKSLDPDALVERLSNWRKTLRVAG